MASELMEALKALAREKNIDEYAMLDRLESSLAATYKKMLDLENDTRVVLDRESGKISVFELVPVGGTEEEPVFEERDVTPADVSRTAAQAAKSVILGMIRDAEREQIFDEYQDRVGDAVTGTVQQSDARYTLIKLREGVEALLPPSEQPSTERYDHNQRIKAYIIEVRKTTTEPSIVVSRTHPGLLKRLFELEVPEIYDGIVEIKSVAREPGMRSKVAVLEPRARPRPGRRVRRPQGQPRPHGRLRAAGRAHRCRSVERRLRAVRGQRAVSRQGEPRHHPRCGALRHRHRAGRPALARHRQGGPERPPRRQAHGLAHRHQEPVAGGRGRPRRGALAVRGWRAGPGRRPLLRRVRHRHPLPQPRRPRRRLLFPARQGGGQVAYAAP